jgi:hypothetical protein
LPARRSLGAGGGSRPFQGDGWEAVIRKSSLLSFEFKPLGEGPPHHATNGSTSKISNPPDNNSVNWVAIMPATAAQGLPEQRVLATATKL